MAPSSEWAEVELPDIVKFEQEGDKHEGYYLGIDTIPASEPFNVFQFRREDGTTWQTAASGGLAPLLRGVPQETYVQIEMTGTRDTGKRDPMKTFVVRRRLG